ncbi:hypothetical protein JXA88_06260 [Candidatus Fermentibacteria bacterium]|nr:hypothetical protein [Candidatus Fermentibacteria bacterium]
MRPFGGPARCIIMAGVSIGRCLAAEIYLSPQIETSVGYDSNRFQMEAGAGSAYGVLMPSIDITSFISSTVELQAALAYQKRGFLREGFSHAEHASGILGLWHAGACWEGGVSLAAARTRDAAIPEDDLARGGFSAGLTYNDLAGRRYEFAGALERVAYDSAEDEDGKSVTGTHWRLRPAVRLPIGPGVFLWGEPVAEGFTCNDPGREYTGCGISLGLDYSPPAPLRAGVSVDLGVHDYANPADASLSKTDATARSFTLWCAMRTSARAELFADLQGGTFWSDDTTTNYGRWQGRLGIRLRHDAEIGPLRRFAGG